MSMCQYLITVETRFCAIIIVNMLEFAAILTTGGLLLFSNVLELEKSILLALINRIIDSKNLESDFTILKYKISYLYDAVLGLVFVIAWRKQIVFDYPDKLLQAMSLQCRAVYDQIIWKNDLVVDAPDFKQPWERAFENWKNYVARKEEKGNVMKKFDQTQKGAKIAKKKDEKDKDQKPKDQKPVEQTNKQVNQEEETPLQSEKNSDVTTSSKVEEYGDLSPRQRFLKMQQEKRKSKSPKNQKSPGKESQDNPNNPRKWQGKINKNDLEQLDFSKKKSGKQAEVSPRSSMYEEIKKQENEKIEGFLDSDDEVDQIKSSTFFSKWMGKVKNIVGDKTITPEDISEVMGEFKKKLMEKNVAQDVAEKVSEAVGKTLIETKTKSFTTVQATVKQALEDALKNILTPKKKIDLIVEINKQKQKLKPYVIVFIGVNGVGKSTNLAKVAYKLKNAKLSVMLAACDNFRAGAVEQIKTHGRNLDIPVFDRGYKEEPSNIAFEAIRDATRKHIDVVLIDTAGRMQDNTPLMKELAQIVKVNKPNLVIFIGEALVGNDAVDQITKFNKAIEQESTDSYKAQINAILLSKFDTVDDKVGTALSLVYSTGKPILYVGVGQKYPNLKELNVKTVVHSLLS